MERAAGKAVEEKVDRRGRESKSKSRGNEPYSASSCIYAFSRMSLVISDKKEKEFVKCSGCRTLIIPGRLMVFLSQFAYIFSR